MRCFSVFATAKAKKTDRSISACRFSSQARRASDFSVSKLDQIVDARLGKWTEYIYVRIASRLGRGNNVIVDNINVLDCSTRSHKEVA